MGKLVPKLRCDSCNKIVSEDLKLTHCPECQSSSVHPDPEPKKKEKKHTGGTHLYAATTDATTVDLDPPTAYTGYKNKKHNKHNTK